MSDDPRRLWVTVIFRRGTDVFGGMWEADKLYLTRIEAIHATEERAIKMGLMPIDWSAPDEKLMIGRTHKPGKPDLTYVVLVRSGQLPQGWRLIPADEPLR